MKKKILVVDDSPFMLSLIGDILTALNYDITTFGNAQDACRQLDSIKFDAIITDMNMPVMDGLEFTKQVRAKKDYRFVPLVMLSSEEDADKISQAKKLGISTFISKPPKKSQLKSIIQIILNKRAEPRKSINLKIFFGENETCSGNSRNISSGGLFLETGHFYPPGKNLSLKFSLPDSDKPIVCEGKVAWTTAPDSQGGKKHPAGLGIEFLDIEGEQQLKDFLKSENW